MKNSFPRKIAALLTLLGIVGFSPTGSAITPPNINGDITFYGGAVLDGPIGTATAFLSFSGPGGTAKPVVGSVSGDYSSVPIGTGASFGPFTFEQPAGTPFVPFVVWQFILGSTVYNFTATSITDVYQDSTSLAIEGTGTAYIDGFAQTPGTWTVIDLGITSVVSFGSAVTVVPEPSVLALLAMFAPVGWLIAVRVRNGSRCQRAR